MKSWIDALILVAAVFLCYYQALDFGFVWDDQLYVVQNQAVHDWSRALEAFTSPRTTWTANPQYNISEWRPLRNISFLVDYSLFGLNPIGYHLHNIALHAIATVLLYFLLRRLCRLFLVFRAENQKYITSCCWTATLFWAWHPVQTEVVAWVKSRDDLLATPLFFAALLMALPPSSGKPGPRIPALLGAIVCYIAALLSKENVVVIAAILPLLLFAYAFYWIGPRPSAPGSSPTADSALAPDPSAPRPFRRAFWVSFVFALITLAALATRDLVLGRTAQASYPGTPVQTILTMASAFTRYVQLITWPWPPTVQMADYDGYRIIHSFTDPLALTGIAILAAIIVLALATRRRAPLVSIGIAFFLIAMMPFSNLIPMMQIMAERFLYLPLAGCAIVVAGIMVEIHSKMLREVTWYVIWFFPDSYALSDSAPPSRLEIRGGAV